MGTSKKKYDYLKRAIDIVGSGAALVALSPIIGAVGLAVRSKLGSPIIFQQERPGKDGKIFTIGLEGAVRIRTGETGDTAI